MTPEPQLLCQHNVKEGQSSPTNEEEENQRQQLETTDSTVSVDVVVDVVDAVVECMTKRERKAQKLFIEGNHHYYERKDLNRAMELYKRCLALHPRHLLALKNLGTLLFCLTARLLAFYFPLSVS